MFHGPAALLSKATLLPETAGSCWIPGWAGSAACSPTELARSRHHTLSTPLRRSCQATTDPEIVGAVSLLGPLLTTKSWPVSRFVPMIWMVVLGNACQT